MEGNKEELGFQQHNRHSNRCSGTLRGQAALWLHEDTRKPSAFSVTSPTVEEGPLAQLAHTAHRREKRCSCENQKDKECIFFCHIGIVWVNTPSHVVPYGFGSLRLRRELGRCICKDARDAECLSFCSNHTQTEERENTVVKRKNDKRLKRYRAAFWEKRSRHALKHQT